MPDFSQIQNQTDRDYSEEQNTARANAATARSGGAATRIMTGGLSGAVSDSPAGNAYNAYRGMQQRRAARSGNGGGR